MSLQKSDMGFLEVSGVKREESGILAVNGISFRQREGERLAVVGETGSGKSTLLRMVAGLLQPNEGQIEFREKRVKGPLQQLIPGHPQIAYLSQHYELRNHYRVEEILQMVCEVPADAAAHIYKVCRIDHLLRRRTDQLSGGERQRIAIARLLTTAPSLLILDEPFSNLDLPHKSELKQVLIEAGNALGISFLLASHDPHDVMAWATRILVLRHGKLVAEGSPEEMYRRPSSAYVAGLFGKFNLVMYGPQPAMLRPEDILINPKPLPLGTLTAVVTQIHFQGFYQEVEVDISGQRLTAYVLLQQEQFQIGEYVKVAIRHKLDVPQDWSRLTNEDERNLR
jgi:ABC-type sulfate/molybdate transport systems ATPase subunit